MTDQPPQELFVEYMYGFLFHYTDSPLFPSKPMYFLVKKLPHKGKGWEAVYKNSENEHYRFSYNGAIELKERWSK